MGRRAAATIPYAEQQPMSMPMQYEVWKTLGRVTVSSPTNRHFSTSSSIMMVRFTFQVSKTKINGDKELHPRRSTSPSSLVIIHIQAKPSQSYISSSPPPSPFPPISASPPSNPPNPPSINKLAAKASFLSQAK